jgi:hypothetical protein
VLLRRLQAMPRQLIHVFLHISLSAAKLLRQKLMAIVEQLRLLKKLAH